ncbi:hypothetical protein Anas_13273 [Armadillidium nasatum]|uniref:Uncharacterized protein n=1 Tax=Armadillidium nasatum TaxID=96803 RepID=A0A5N5SMZ4_9CRUS|nr:hypothetical protein Anas_13273 [Armadillidium nasatum]
MLGYFIGEDGGECWDYKKEGNPRSQRGKQKQIFLNKIAQTFARISRLEFLSYKRRALILRESRSRSTFELFTRKILNRNKFSTKMKIFLSFVLLCAIVGTQAFYIEDGSRESGGKYDLFEIADQFDGEDNEDLVLDPSEDISDEDSDSDFDSLVRTKRQVANQAMDLALSHQDRNGNDRAVGQLHGRVDLNAVGRDARNYHAHGGLGAGAVVWRSRNNRHSLGVGAYADQQRGRFQGFRLVHSGVRTTS